VTESTPVAVYKIKQLPDGPLARAGLFRAAEGRAVDQVIKPDMMVVRLERANEPALRGLFSLAYSLSDRRRCSRFATCHTLRTLPAPQSRARSGPAQTCRQRTVHCAFADGNSYKRLRIHRGPIDKLPERLDICCAICSGNQYNMHVPTRRRSKSPSCCP